MQLIEQQERELDAYWDEIEQQRLSEEYWDRLIDVIEKDQKENPEKWKSGNLFEKFNDVKWGSLADLI